MDFLFNDCSVHEQFNSHESFFQAAESVLKMREAIKRAGHEIYCHRNLRGAFVSPGVCMPEAVQRMRRDTRQIWLTWLTKGGPFWDEVRQHGSDEWLEVENEILVTDTAVGEAAYCLCNGLERELVSLSPSNWNRHPIAVEWRANATTRSRVNVSNYWHLNALSQRLSTIAPTFSSWDSLEKHLRRTCFATCFSDEFLQMRKYPYVKSVAEGINILLQALNKLSDGIDDQGRRTADAELVYETYFTGADPYCTDESTSNKSKYENRMTFPDPTGSGAMLFCPWHGKVNSPSSYPPIRIHFAWPINQRGSLVVPYVGKKLTMD